MPPKTSTKDTMRAEAKPSSTDKKPASAGGGKMQRKQEYKMRSAVEMKLLQDLRFSKSSYMPWGRLVVRAIDFDDCLQLVKVFETMANLGAQVDVRATGDNYGGYAWTHFRHNFIGDTALHLALRCVRVCVLLSSLFLTHANLSLSPL